MIDQVHKALQAGRLLLVGDPHVTVDDLADCRALGGHILEVAQQQQAAVVLLGDQYHNHGLVHLRVMGFWRDFLWKAHLAGVPVAAVVGNHDRESDGNQDGPHALMAHEDRCLVIDRPIVAGKVLFAPFYHKPNSLVAVATAYPGCPTLVCHGTFDGCLGDNGLPLKDGVDPNLLPQKQIISGHIHGPQEFGKVWYLGAPRWRTRDDANVDRAIWLVEMNQEGNVTSRTPFPTGGVCRRIHALEDREGTPVDLASLDPRHDWRIDVYGAPAWCESRKVLLERAGARVRSFPDRMEAPAVKESDGIQVAFRKYLGAFKPKHGTPAEILEAMARERLGV